MAASARPVVPVRGRLARADRPCRDPGRVAGPDWRPARRADAHPAVPGTPVRRADGASRGRPVAHRVGVRERAAGRLVRAPRRRVQADGPAGRLVRRPPGVACAARRRSLFRRPARARRGHHASAEEHREIASDGISYWVLHENRWHEYDPASARRGRMSVPAFFDSALADARPGIVLTQTDCRLLPVQPGLEGSPFGSKDGLLRPAGDARPELRCLDGLFGRREPQPGDHQGRSGPAPAPAARRRPAPRADGLGTARYCRAVRQRRPVPAGPRPAGRPRQRTCAAGTRFLPPLWYWHALRPRDEHGSAALRAVTDADATALLAAVRDGESPREAVARLLPAVTDERLALGVAGLVEETARCAKRIATLGERAERGSPRSQDEEEVRHAYDHVLREALAGAHRSRTLLRLLRQRATRHHRGRPAQGAALTVGPGTPPSKFPFVGTGVAWLSLIGPGTAAAALRAAAPTTPESRRTGLLEFLDVVLSVGDGVLVDTRGRLRVVQLKASRSEQPGARRGGAGLGRPAAADPVLPEGRRGRRVLERRRVRPGGRVRPLGGLRAWSRPRSGVRPGTRPWRPPYGGWWRSCGSGDRCPTGRSRRGVRRASGCQRGGRSAAVSSGCRAWHRGRTAAEHLQPLGAKSAQAQAAGPLSVNSPSRNGSCSPPR